jgi:hypothetical protein
LPGVNIALNTIRVVRDVNPALIMKVFGQHEFTNATDCESHTILIARKMWCDKC